MARGTLDFGEGESLLDNCVQVKPLMVASLGFAHSGFWGLGFIRV